MACLPGSDPGMGVDSVPASATRVPDSIRAKGYILPISLLAYGCLKPALDGIGRIDGRVRERISARHPQFRTQADDYLQWLPSASVHLLQATGVRMRHDARSQWILDAGSVLVAGGAGFLLRRISERMPGFGIVDTEFPSGHTTNAFRGAELLRQELKGSHPSWSYGGYAVAAGVAVARLYNRQHLLSEVLAGAGLGMLSTKLTYWVFQRTYGRKRRG